MAAPLPVSLILQFHFECTVLEVQGPDFVSLVQDGGVGGGLQFLLAEVVAFELHVEDLYDGVTDDEVEASNASKVGPDREWDWLSTCR